MMNQPATPLNGPPRLLGVFAHPDDEVFCAGGTLAQWAASGCETTVVSATRGEAGQVQDAHIANRRTLGAVREQELRAACARLGVQQVTCLDYRDGTLHDVDISTLARDIGTEIRAFSPDVVLTFGPDGGYGHPDHVAISVATTLACRQLSHIGEPVSDLYYSVFPRRHRLLGRGVARWLLQRHERLAPPETFPHAFRLLAGEAALLGYADDSIEVRWFPAGLTIVEQGEPGASLYLLTSGKAEVVQESADGARRVLRRLGAGEFFGAEAVAHHQPQAASLVATEALTCLVLSSPMPGPFNGRGSEPLHVDTAMKAGSGQGHDQGDFTHNDVAAWLGQKLAALSEHRSQFVLEPGLFPPVLLGEWLGSEYFASAPLTALEGTALPRDGGITLNMARGQAMKGTA